MKRTIGTSVYGLRAPIVRKGDHLPAIVVSTVLQAAADSHIELRDRDIVCVTEAVVARAQGNYVTVDDIAHDIAAKFGDVHLGITGVPLSRNRFAISLRGFARGVKRMTLLFPYPTDEVGNPLMDMDTLDDAGIDPWVDVLTEARYRELAGDYRHFFTGIDYVAYYREIVEAEGCELTILFGNDPREILAHTEHVLVCDIHTRARTKRLLKNAVERVAYADGTKGPGAWLVSGRAQTVYGMDEIMTAPVNGSGYNPDYGLLGSNKATEEMLKLFPRDGQSFVNAVAEQLYAATGKRIEVLIFGDGCFKDSVGKVWELMDPVVSPAYTDGLDGLPSELKLKYLADNEFAGLQGEALHQAIVQAVASKQDDLRGSMSAEGTTPRRLTDLIGSLCDLTSGSGDKGTPFVLIQGYFDNISDGA